MKCCLIALPIILIVSTAAGLETAPPLVPAETAETAPAAPHDAVPEAAEAVEQVLDDEEKTLAFVKEFDDTQQTLAKADMATAQELARQAQQDKAKERAATAQERVRQVRELYELVFAHYPKNAELHNAYGELLYDVFGDIGLGVKEWKTAVSLDEDLSAAHNNLAIHYAHYGDYALALNHLDRALKLDGENSDYLFNAAQIYLAHAPQVAELKKWSEKKLFRKAMDYSHKAAQLSPQDYELQQDYAVNFFAAENFEVEADWKDAAAAWQQARSLTQRPDQVFYTWLNEGRAWLRGEDLAKARAAFEQAYAMRPSSDVARALLEKAGGNPAAVAATAERAEAAQQSETGTPTDAAQ